MSEKRRVSACLCCAALSLGSIVYGATGDDDKDTTIRVTTRPIIVTAYRNTGAYGGAELPEAQKTVVTEKQISANNYKTVEDVLRQVNGVTLNSMVPGTASFVRINGDDRVNILVDGQSLANAQGASYGRGMVDLSTLPGVDNISAVEVVKGAGSVRYGAGAVGGTINIITKKGKKNRTVLDTAFGSWGKEYYSLLQEGSKGDTSWFVSGSLDKKDYYKFPDSARSDKAAGDNRAESLTFRIDRKLNKSQSMTLNVSHKDSRGHAVSFDSPYGIAHRKFSVKQYKPLERLSNNVSLTWNFRENTSTPGHIRYFNDYSKTWWTNRFHTRTQGIQADRSWMTKYHFFTLGAEWTLDSGSNDGANYKNKKKSNRAVYGEDMIVYKKWSFTPGLRLDKNSHFGFHKTPRLAVEYRAGDNLNIYGSWSRVYTAPRLNDMYYNGTRSRGNPDLKPESGYSQTVGLDWAMTKNTLLRFSLFHSYLNDAIRWDRSITPYEVRNLNKEDKRGIDLSLQHKIGATWEWELAYTYTKINIDEGRGMRRDPSNSQPNGYRASLQYHEGKWKVNLQLSAGTGREDRYYVKKTYATWDLNASYSANKRLTLYGVVHNLTDDGYDLYHGYPDSGRSCLFGMKYSF